MNSYPQEFLTQLRPLMFVAGLEKFVAPAASEETSEDDRVLSKQLPPSDPFMSLAKRLKDTMTERSVKKGTIWMTDDDRAQPSFRVAFVDKDVRFPPQKTPTQEHSPLSPLTPTSPLYPDGLIAPIWIRKHSDLLPSVFVLFLRLFEHSQSQSAPLSPLHNQSFSDKEMETRRNEERKRDTELSAEISSRKRVCADRGVKLTVVLLTSRKMLDDPNLDPRLTFIRRQSSLDSRAALFVLSPINPSELQEFVKSLQTALYEPSLEHYLNHSKKARRKRNRYTGAYGTLPASQHSSNTPRSGSQPLRSQGWIIRYEYKMGCFAEFRGEEEVARKHYQNAWEGLVEMFGSASLLPPRTKRWAEAKVLIECISFKIIKFYLYRGEHTRAMTHFKTHLTRFIDFSTGWEIGRDTWEFWGSISRWYRLMAELLEMGLATSLALPDYTPSPETVLSPPSSSQEFPFEPQHIGINPNTILQHPGYYYYAAAMCTQRRLEQFILASQAKRDSQSSLANEKKVDHRIIMLELYTKSYEMFKKYTQDQSQGRFTFHIAFQIAVLYHDSGKYDMAIKFLERIVKLYRREQWNSMLTPILKVWHACAHKTGDIATMISSVIEMACHSTRPNIEVHKQLEETIKGVSSPLPSLKVDLSEAPTLFPTTLSFYQNTADISQLSNFQIHVQFGHRVPPVIRALSSLKIEFSSQMSWIISHRTSAQNEQPTKLRMENLGLVHMQRQGELHADLNSVKDGTLVLSGEVVSDTAINLRVSRITYTIELPWELDLVFGPVPQPVIDSLWLTSLLPPVFTPLRRDASYLTVRRKACQVELMISHESPAYLDENSPITLTVVNVDEYDINVTLDILLQPSPDESVNKVYIEDTSSPALIKGFSVGSLRPAESVQKILHLQSTGLPGDRIIDISVQASPANVIDEGPSTTRVNEMLRTVTIPTIAPISISTVTSYRQRTEAPPLPSDLSTYTSTDEQACTALVKTILTNPGPNHLVILGIDYSIDNCSNPKAQLASSSLTLDENPFPLEFCVDDSYAVYSQFKLYSNDNNDEPVTSGQYHVRWSRLPSQGNIATTNVSIPPFTAQPDSVYAALELPAMGVLHVPFVAVLRIHNRHPWKTLDARFQLEPSDHFVVSGLRNGTLPLLVGGSEERIPFNMIPISCGLVRLPVFKITQRKKEASTQVKEEEEVEKRYPVIDGRLEERNERTEDAHVDETVGTNDAEGIYMSIFPA